MAAANGGARFLKCRAWLRARQCSDRTAGEGSSGAAGDRDFQEGATRAPRATVSRRRFDSARASCGRVVLAAGRRAGVLPEHRPRRARCAPRAHGRGDHRVARSLGKSRKMPTLRLDPRVESGSRKGYEWALDLQSSGRCAALGLLVLLRPAELGIVRRQCFLDDLYEITPPERLVEGFDTPQFGRHVEKVRRL